MTKLELIEEKIKKLPEDALDDIEKYIDKILDSEHKDWAKFSMDNLSRAYSENEPDYSDVLIKEPNPKYKP